MKRPWQVWLFFSISLAIVLSAMGWLSFKAVELDRAEALTRHQAELEENIGLALWRIDARLTPLLAQEAARPYYTYHPFHTAPGVGADVSGPIQLLPSPLLVQPSEFVLLHFQLHSDGRVTSPQYPSEAFRQWAVDNGSSIENMRRSASLLEQFGDWVDHQHLSSRLPVQTLSTIAAGQTVWANNFDLANVDNAQVVKNTLDFEQVQQQLNQPPNVAPQQANSAVATESPRSTDDQASRQQGIPRAGNDYQSRNNVYQRIAQQEVFNQRINLATAPPMHVIREGVSQPLWVDTRLLLARRVETGDEVVVQGVWLDWPKIKRMLATEVADLLPSLDLEPVDEDSDIHVSRLLATLPVQLVVPDAVAVPATMSPIRISQKVAWISMLAVAVDAPVLLQGIVTLSERRGAFVSAVTHELRTPLTTFRIYAEMLAEGMVPEAERRQHYLETLRIEADRLSHLVENVLAYARLERGKPDRKRETIAVDCLLDQVQTRLDDRVQQAGMELVVEADDSVRRRAVSSDPGAVDQILFNLIDNACKYASAAEDRRIFLEVFANDAEVCFRVRDHGPGISAGEAKRLFRPFSKSAQQAASSAPGVGLGLALCRRLARALGGRLELESTSFGGASFLLTFPQAG